MKDVSYASQQISAAMIELLKENAFSDISVSEICEKAQVSRNSFYRNFADREDILYKHIRFLLNEWDKYREYNDKGSGAEFFGNVFAFLKHNEDFFSLLSKRNMLHVLLRVIKDMHGAKPEHDNIAAYLTSFMSYGTFGWIEEWINRGMQESAESMTELLSKNGMK